MLNWVAEDFRANKLFYYVDQARCSEQVEHCFAELYRGMLLHAVLWQGNIEKLAPGLLRVGNQFHESLGERQVVVRLGNHPFSQPTSGQIIQSKLIVIDDRLQVAHRVENVFQNDKALQVKLFVQSKCLHNASDGLKKSWLFLNVIVLTIGLSYNPIT